jgi:hypothetical protein
MFFVSQNGQYHSNSKKKFLLEGRKKKKRNFVAHSLNYSQIHKKIFELTKQKSYSAI